jgi:agmatine/peptidylarginine deiminase
MLFPVYWKNGSLETAREHYSRVAETIAMFEPVTMIVNEGAEADAARH